MRSIAPGALARLLAGGEELAVLDAREEGEFGEAHLFWSVPCPLSAAELCAPRLLPRLSVPVVAVDAGGGLAVRLGAVLAELGCSDVSVLEGGVGAWRDAGFELFSGVNVPSKAFGEWVAQHYGTESIDAVELERRQRDGQPMVVLDSRTFEEFERMCIPGGISVPGGELVYRIADLVPDPATLIVVNCAGRTRSILGAESLRRAGIPNRVVALCNGTMGWELAGFTCERGAARRHAPGTPASAALARERAQSFALAAGVSAIGPERLAALAADPARSLYLLDVRSPREFHAGHFPDSLSAPGGQLVQATDRWVAVRGARLGLIDDTGVRARMAGGWLRRMGPWEVFVVEGALEPAPGNELRTGPEPRPEPPSVPAITVTELVDWQSQPGTLVIDCARSLDYRAGHIPDAVWGLRSRLGALASSLRAAARVAVTSPDGWLARHTVAELVSLTAAPVHALSGGTKAWAETGNALEASPSEPPDQACVDAYLRPYDRTAGLEEAMRAYLEWEVGLAAQLAREPSVAFGQAGARAGS